MPSGDPVSAGCLGLPQPGAWEWGEGGRAGLSPSPFLADPLLSPSPAASPPAPGTELSYLNGTFRLLQKPLSWHDALLLCESYNTSLAHVLDPYTQAFLTQAARGLRTPLWIGLASEEVSCTDSPDVPPAPSGPPAFPGCSLPPALTAPSCPGLPAVLLGLGGATELRGLAGQGAPTHRGLRLRGCGWGLAHDQLRNQAAGGGVRSPRW